MVALNDKLSDAQVALRMKDNAKLASTTKNMKRTEKNIIKIASSLRNFSKPPATRFSASVEEIEMVGVIREVINATVSTSVAVFLATAGIASSVMKKRSVEGRSMQELQGFEESIGAVERRSERVLRCLINARVTLLSLVNPL
ncbi:uncharacterized protein A4U43_C07F22380 [Asparagus officinalis]|uniref:Uncharacterized protein n=2 Tax=Asparagus officinalis TaxID=4686 RepID=A0A5P1EH29_ASPOF|nr:uncharacterized protein A4U43_C07F22380 [Asparagus officinalis]